MKALEWMCPADEVTLIQPDSSGYLKLEGDSYVVSESGPGPKVIEGEPYFLRWDMCWVEKVTGRPSKDVITLNDMVSNRYKNYFDLKDSIEHLKKFQ